jgi:O-antigen ligase
MSSEKHGIFGNLPYLVFTLFLLVFFIGFNPFPSYGGFRDLDQRADGSLLRQISLVFFFAYFSFSLFRQSLLLNYIRNNLYVLSLIFLCFSSFLWSLDSSLTIRRSVVLFINFFVVTSFFYLVGYSKSIKLIRNVFAFLIIFSVLLSLFYSGAVHQAADVFDVNLIGSWRGVFGHKNNAAAFSVTALVIFLLSWFSGKEKKWIALSVLSVIFLFMTKSKTSIYILFPLIVFSFLVVYFIENKFLVIVSSFTLLVVFSFLFFALGDVKYFLYDNPDLFTGRGAIWFVMLEIIQDNFLFGLGYGAVWETGDWSIMSEYADRGIAWTALISSGHSGYFDILISIGFIGFLFFFISVLYPCLLNAINFSSVLSSKSLFLMLFLYIIFYNFMESGFLVSDSAIWFSALLLYSLKFDTQKWSFK